MGPAASGSCPEGENQFAVLIDVEEDGEEALTSVGEEELTAEVEVVDNEDVSDDAPVLLGSGRPPPDPGKTSVRSEGGEGSAAHSQMEKGDLEEDPPPERPKKVRRSQRLVPVRTERGWKFYWVPMSMRNPKAKFERGERLEEFAEVPEQSEASFLGRAMDLAGPLAGDFLATWDGACKAAQDADETVEAVSGPRGRGVKRVTRRMRWNTGSGQRRAAFAALIDWVNWREHIEEARATRKRLREGSPSRRR